MSETLRSQADPSLAKVRLRGEATHSLRTCSGEPFVMVQDPVQSHYYRLGITEWRIAKLFDGQRTLRQVVAAAIGTLGQDHVSATDVVKLAHWLTQNELAETVEGALRSEQQQIQSTAAWVNPLQQATRLGAWNPLFVKVAFPDPQPLLRAVYPLMRWLFAPLSMLIWVGVCIAGVLAVGGQWERFTSSLGQVFSPGQWWQLLIVWMVLKVLHEFGHAVCCLRFGGRVTRCGLMFIMFSPIAWVDVTSAWGFRSKWRRIAVSAAGMYVEFFFAAVAAIVWANTTSPWLATLSRNVVISASVTSLLFNLNFLMRFDGYFILADLLDMQNLYAAGQQYLHYVQRRYLLGMSSIPPKFTGLRLHLVRAYGVAAMLWRIVFYVGIVIVAANLFHGAGLILGIFSGVLWFGLPCARLCFTLFATSPTDPPNRVRFTAVCSICLLAALGAMHLPWPGSTRAHGYVEYSPLQRLRVDHGGFVREIRVVPGEQVQEGQVLMTLENPTLARELADLDLQIQIQEIERRVMHRDDELARYAAAAKKVESLTEQRKQLADQLESLTVRAPLSGTVITSDLDSMLGKFLTPGTELLSVGATGKKEIRVSIPQQDVDLFRAATQQHVQLKMIGHRLPNGDATFSHVTPRATRRILHPALAATAGGPLTVESSQASDGKEQVLVEPYFEGVVEVPQALSEELCAGEVCLVSLGRGQQRVYERLWSLGRAYFASKSQT